MSSTHYSRITNDINGHDAMMQCVVVSPVTGTLHVSQVPSVQCYPLRYSHNSPRHLIQQTCLREPG